ncbi:probable ATP synthase subunit gamma, mitochondrial [Saccharomycodes ludwigii]|uniref:ATP synthase subunit gamma n=1 Tax=Saccharomycodes ludwigii TaxID=36035 RepID=A0A376B8Q5_9ASCO|nr:probable ATP synthase subunit gamma, mitochondrial [Saccharomycodes ludwigii]
MYKTVGTNLSRSLINSQRNYATLREIETRLKSIKNIEKITKTMKIVASTRLTKAERAKVTSDQYVKADQAFYNNAETAEVKEEEKEPTNLIIAITSDKGLCGSIHSQLAKAVRNRLKEIPTADVITIGDKIKNQIMRTHASNLKLAFNGVGKSAPTFEESSLIANKILDFAAEKTPYTTVEIHYNNPVSSLSFEPSIEPVYSAEQIKKSPGISRYEIDGDAGVPQDLFEFALANKILASMGNGYCAEVSARRNAMDNASKNAGDMINRYSILYNRTRQAVITNELVDIITGATALD